MKIVYTSRAVADLRRLSAYLRARSPQGAKNVRATIRATIALLEYFPAIGTPQNVPGVYRLVTRGYPYLVYYTLDHQSGEAAILTIRHAAQKREYDDA